MADDSFAALGAVGGSRSRAQCGYSRALANADHSTRRDLALLAFAFAVAMAGTTLPTPLYPLYERSLGISPAIVTVVFAVYAVAVVAGLMSFGHQSDRVGRRKTLLTGLMLSAFSALCFIFAWDLIPVYAGRVLSGLSAGIFAGAGTAAMIDYAPADAAAGSAQRRAIALLAVVVNVGGLGLGTLLSGLLAQFAPLPLRLPYLVDFVLTLVAMVAVLRVRETVRGAGGHFTFSFQHLRVPAEVRSIFVRASIVGVCAFAVSGVFSAVAPELLGVQLGVHSPAVTGALVFLLMGSSAFGQVLVDRIPRRLAFACCCVLLAFGMLLLAGSIVLHALALLFLSSLFSGVGQGIVMGFGLANINEKITSRRGEVTSAYFVLIYLGLALPVVAVGFAAVPFGLSLTGLVFCGLVGVICLGVGFWPGGSGGGDTSVRHFS